MTEKVAESPHEEAATADRVAELWAKVLALEAEKPVNDLEVTQTLEQLVTPAMRKLTGHPVLLASLGKLGQYWERLGNPKRAHQCLFLAVSPELKPDGMSKQQESAYRRGLAAAHDKIARIFQRACGEYEMASQHWEQCLRLEPTCREGILGYSVHLFGYGFVKEALALFKEFEKHLPEDEYCGEAWSNKLLAMNYVCGEELTVEDIYAEHQRWAAVVKKRFAAEAFTEHPNCKDPVRRLKIGYLSPDLCGHTVALYSEVLLKYRDPEKYHLTAYFCKKDEDAHSGRLREYVDKWVNLFGTTAGEAARIIRDDQIDILVELTGHTANNRLDILACRPAPIQVTWIGYPNTTGLDCIHYRVTDPVTDPVNTNQPFAEKLIRLPDCFLCFTPNCSTPDVKPPPFEDNGCVTFGSFNSLGKVQRECFDLWIRVLRAVPYSRIALKSNRAFSMPFIREYWHKKFEDQGITRDRVILIGFMPSQDEHLSAYHQVDIALDAFPYGGTTTISEAMYMGVPVVTLRAPIHRPLHSWNVGLGMNTTIGLTDLIAETKEEYVQIAQELAASKDRLRDLRATLREKLISSPLGDGPRFQRNVEAMYRTMWSEFCNGDWPPNRFG